MAKLSKSPRQRSFEVTHLRAAQIKSGLQRALSWGETAGSGRGRFSTCAGNPSSLRRRPTRTRVGTRARRWGPRWTPETHSLVSLVTCGHASSQLELHVPSSLCAADVAAASCWGSTWTKILMSFIQRLIFALWNFRSPVDGAHEQLRASTQRLTFEANSATCHDKISTLNKRLDEVTDLPRMSGIGISK